MKALLIIFGILCTSFMEAQNSFWPTRLSDKVDKTVSSVFVDFEELTISPYNSDFLNSEGGFQHFWNNLLSVQTKDQVLGYIYVDQAKSMKNLFDYITVFDPNFQIIKSKVLIYREQHGKQISSVRWLKQFNKMTPQSKPVLGENIDGISGATISVTSMTQAVHNLLERIRVETTEGNITIHDHDQ